MSQQEIVDSTQIRYIECDFNPLSISESLMKNEEDPESYIRI